MEWLNNLKQMKLESDLTTKEIAQISKIPEPTLEKLFAGQTKDPKLSTIRAVVHCLGFTLDDLCPEIKNSPDSGKPDTEEELQTRIQILLDLCNRMGFIEQNGDISDETLRMLMALIDFLDSWFSKAKT